MKINWPRIHWFFYVLIFILILGWSYLFFAYGLPFLLPDKVVSNGEVNGLLIRNQIWEGEVRIVGDILTLPGTKVVVRPGTVVKISTLGDRFNFHYWPWLLKSGINTGTDYHGVYTNEPFWDEGQKIQIYFSQLEALGTKEQPIYFISAATQSSRYDINSITVDHGIIASALFANYRRLNIKNNVVVRDSILKESGECNLCISGGKPSVIDNQFEQSLRQSILVEGGSPRISNNLFVNLSGDGVVVDPQRVGTPEIVNNVFEMPGKTALILLSGLDIKPGIVQYNKFSGNSKIKIACDSQIKFSQNSILGLVDFIGSGCAGEYTFGPNYWGVNDAKTLLQERILNKGREFKVNLPVILTVPPLGVGRKF
jgi:hypothetical protein